jgi:hypothetical protein
MERRQDIIESEEGRYSVGGRRKRKRVEKGKLQRKRRARRKEQEKKVSARKRMLEEERVEG